MKRILLIFSMLLLSVILISCGKKQASVINEMKIVFADNDTENSVTNDITLTTTSSVDNAIITWESNKTDVIKIEGNKGIVTRKEIDTEVTLTVKVTIKDFKEEKPFKVIVKALIEIKGYELILPENVTSDQENNNYIEYGTKVELTINVPSGKELRKLTINGINVTDDVIDNKYIINKMTENVIIDVEFAIQGLSALVKSKGQVTTARTDGELLNSYLDSLPSVFSVFYNRNSAGTHSIFNNTVNEIRLYPGSINGGAITIKIESGYGIYKIEVETGDTNAGFSVNDNGNYTHINSTESISLNLVQEVTVKNIANATSGATNQVRIKGIKVYYTDDLSGHVDDEAPKLRLSNEAKTVYALGDVIDLDLVISWVIATDNIDEVVIVELDHDLSIDEENKFNLVGEFNLIFFTYDTAGNYSELVVKIKVFETLDGLLESIDYSGFNDYYIELSSSSDIITDMAWLLRDTIRYVTYGEARYVYVEYHDSPETQVILYDYYGTTSYKKVPKDWGTGGQITIQGGTTLSVDREHVWSSANMRIRPANNSSSNNTYVGFLTNLNNEFDYEPKNDKKGHYSDLHNLWLAVSSTNRSRGNDFFGEENGMSLSPYRYNQIFYPGDEYRGDIARIMFYMTLMYPHLTIVERNSNLAPGTIYQGYLDVLLKWNEEDPVSEYEITRNEQIFGLQKNRNPFVDFYNQGFAEKLFIFGDPNVLDDSSRIIS